jgi:hypothetical protein
MMSDPIPSFTPPPNKPSQIRCPLTLKRLDQIRKLSDEHIIHEAIGGPRWYSVKADADENSRFGSGADSRFLNSIVVKAWRIHHGILGKAEQELSLRLPGTVKGTDQKVEVTLKKGSAEVDYVPRVVRDRKSGKGKITVSENRLDAELARVTKDFRKKGLRLTVMGQTSDGQPELDIPFSVEAAPILAGVLKVLYLTGFYFLGNSFLDDPLNPAWLRAIQAETMEALIGSGIRFSETDSGGVPCPLEPSQHCILMTNAGPNGHLASAHLFGGQIGIVAQLSAKGQFGMPESMARMVICEAKESSARGIDNPNFDLAAFGLLVSPSF